jgi:hypothetical protein
MKVQVYPEHADDPVAFAEVEGEGVAQLRHLQHIIGGYVEQLHTHRMDMKQNILLVDEDARTKNRQPNFRATSATGYPTILFGTVVVAGIHYDRADGGTLKWSDIHE